MNKAVIPLVVGLALGVVAIKMGLDVVKRAQGQNAPGGTADVVVAAKTIPLATEITKQMLTTVVTAKGLVPPGSFGDPNEVIGRVSRTEVGKGIPLVQGVLAPIGSAAGMPSRIPAGYRAVTVKVDEASQVGGFLQPKCRVDVAVVMTTKVSGKNQTISRVILQNVEVAAVGQSLEGEAAGATLSRSVTLLLQPDDVSKLHLASTKGKVRLAMRGQADAQFAMSETMTENELLGGVAPKQGGDVSLLGGLLHGFGQSLSPQPMAAAGESQVQAAQAQARQQPWMVEVIEGAKFTPVVFRGPDSMDRVGAGGMDNFETARVASRPQGQASASRGWERSANQVFDTGGSRTESSATGDDFGGEPDQGTDEAE